MLDFVRVIQIQSDFNQISTRCNQILSDPCRVFQIQENLRLEVWRIGGWRMGGWKTGGYWVGRIPFPRKLKNPATMKRIAETRGRRLEVWRIGGWKSDSIRFRSDSVRFCHIQLIIYDRQLDNTW